MATRHPERYRALLLRLREARKSAGMSQEAAAAALGVRQKYISKIETGERRLDPVELQELALLYGKAIQFFLE
jgi:transcriptional regulator with XRE-family HTH domain